MAFLAQTGAALMAYSIALLGVLGRPPTLWTLAIAQAVLAAILSRLFSMPRWWQFIHLEFVPAIVLALQLALPPWLYAAGFLLLALVYWSSFRTRVPLFLSNRITVHRLAAWLPDTPNLRVLDLGSGTGSFVRRLARLRPDWQIDGAETAPAPWLLSRWLAHRQPNAQLVRQDFWQLDLGDYDLIYAFLSPAPMTALWQKASREMKPGALLISNSFPVPGRQPDELVSVGDRRGTCLFCYRAPAGNRRNRKKDIHRN
ncbi:MAG: hypothetical protein BSR46_08640 [Candidatus Dactylopiibacterium carminicum]|nr:MAG: hypothetical protein BSR46_08640 [Candidatus Dactylopiibacterium carminicum]